MHPSVSEQLAGMSRVLAGTVRPALGDPYPVDVLDGIIAALDTLSESWADVPTFIRWDAERTAAVLHRLGVETPAPPADDVDIAALEAHHAQLRDRLGRAIPDAVSDPDTNAAIVTLFRERIDRFPFGQLAPRRSS